jgi:hypothetical protein
VRVYPRGMVLYAFFVTLYLSSLGYAEGEERNPWQSPSGPPSTMRRFEHEYDLARENKELKLQMALLGIFGAALSSGLSRTAMNFPGPPFDNIDHANLIGLPLLLYWGAYKLNFILYEFNESSRVQESLLSQERYEHLRFHVDTSEPLPCRATLASLLNPFRRSRALSRLVPMAAGAGFILGLDHWNFAKESVVGRLKYFLFPIRPNHSTPKKPAE